MILYSSDAAADRSVLRDLLGLPHVDAGDGWLIFALPPAELGIHPTEGEATHELFFMCQDIEQRVDELKGHGVEFSGPVSNAGFGLITRMKVPGAGEVGLYQPKHASPLDEFRGA